MLKAGDFILESCKEKPHSFVTLVKEVKGYKVLVVTLFKARRTLTQSTKDVVLKGSFYELTKLEVTGNTEEGLIEENGMVNENESRTTYTDSDGGKMVYDYEVLDEKDKTQLGVYML